MPSMPTDPPIRQNQTLQLTLLLAATAYSAEVFGGAVWIMVIDGPGAIGQVIPSLALLFSCFPLPIYFGVAWAQWYLWKAAGYRRSAFWLLYFGSVLLAVFVFVGSGPKLSAETLRWVSGLAAGGVASVTWSMFAILLWAKTVDLSLTARTEE